MNTQTFEIDGEGDIQTIYTDEVCLYELGEVSNVRRASNILFDEGKQEWVVHRASDGKEVHRNKNRIDAIRWEILSFSPGGEHYEQR